MSQDRATASLATIPEGTIVVGSVLAWPLKEPGAFRERFVAPAAILLTAIAYAVFVTFANQSLAVPKGAPSVARNGQFHVIARPKKWGKS